MALGHLHRRQRMPAAAPVHYSGSPLAVDFGEQDNTNVVCLVEVAPDTPAKVTDLPITLRPPAADGHRHRRRAAGRSGRLRRGLPAGLRCGQAAYAGMREELLEALPNALEIRIDPQFSLGPHSRRRGAAPQHRTPAELFADYCADSRVDDPRVTRLFDELHDELTTPGRS